MSAIVMIDQGTKDQFEGGIDDFQPGLPDPRSVVGLAPPPPWWLWLWIPPPSLGRLVVTSFR
jgi:hypothetical protein